MAKNALSKNEKLNNLKELNCTDKVYPLDKCLHAFIEEQALKTPFARALTYDGKSLSYEVMNKQANQLAHYLKSKGVGPETLVGICAYRSAEMLIGLLAILKAGGAYVPFDPTYPAGRLEFMINDSKVPVILAQKSCDTILPKASADIIYFEDTANIINSYPTSNPKIEVRPENLAYVIYTSGSTGNPKGAMNTHKGIVNRLLWMQDTFQIGPMDTLIQKTPFSFDVSVWEFFWPFMFGSRLAVAKPEGHKDPEYLLDLISRESVTVIHFVPSMLRLFLETADPQRCVSLKHVVLSGEAVTLDLQHRYFSLLKAPLHNLYGPTEAAVDVTYWQCDPSTSLSTVPIGRPISNIRLYILDKTGQPVAAGENGELHIGGVGVGRGYLNRPELTAEKFVNDPFSDDPSARLYKTGDLCRYLPDGDIDYLGRIDFQVKIRGNRIELGEIEAVVQQDPSVRQCAVTVREDSPGEKRLVAYVVEVPGKFSISDMRKKLAKKLPDYMIPAVFMLLPSLPLTPSGKTDRRALPKPGRERPKLENQYIATGTETEKKLAQVWCEVLQLDQVGIDDNFFDVGGNSIQLAQVHSRLQVLMDREFPIMDLFVHTTIRAAAAFFLKDTKTERGVSAIQDRAQRQREALAARRNVRH
jgi:amino acid adenylation domain-containing protein